MAAVDKNEIVRPSISETTIRTLESKSRSRNKLTIDTLSKSLSKMLRTDRTAEVSPGLVEAVAIARDFNAPAVAVKIAFSVTIRLDAWSTQGILRAPLTNFHYGTYL
jgi:hypothetical protein